MRILPLVLVALAVAGSSAAQRRARIGPTVSSISIENGSGGSNAFNSFGGSLALLSGDDGEFGLGVSRYGDLSNNSCVRQMTFVGLESNYYPVGASGVAPFASTAVGLARVLDQDPTLALLGCSTGAQTANELGLGFGLGVRFNFGKQFAALIEGRFFQVPNSAIKALEGRANVSFAFGSPNKKSQLLNGTLGPAIGVLLPLSGPLEGRSGTVGVRFHREQRKGGALGLQIDYAPLRVRTGCSGSCEPYAILFAPGYEPSLHPAWGRLYAELGLLLAGFPQIGQDRGVAQGAHGGLGADIFSGRTLMTNVNARVLWLQRNDPTNRNAFLVQLGVSLSPRLEHASH
ncbi:MAG: hypothetical protein DMD38_12490 [Gemmatimonadetes bacterium]|nr:MAG: hypothetical protein AUI86_10940 [Gemmatimonadetes bacterium 13_1_40CM_3_66_12]OLD88869.1 MAG: hypothetical protein AUG85_03370 [Gemmatimonadetes bacterium 13_1_20CM_4_66_11]PYP95410.1 MAG: hypothetical protein DMD38_12490 [Gemmatimonadota bacterium]